LIIFPFWEFGRGDSIGRNNGEPVSGGFAEDGEGFP
jgi:hypothetical protein